MQSLAVYFGKEFRAIKRAIYSVSLLAFFLLVFFWNFFSFQQTKILVQQYVEVTSQRMKLEGGGLFLQREINNFVSSLNQGMWIKVELEFFQDERLLSRSHSQRKGIFTFREEYFQTSELKAKPLKVIAEYALDWALLYSAVVSLGIFLLARFIVTNAEKKYSLAIEGFTNTLKDLSQKILKVSRSLREASLDDFKMSSQLFEVHDIIKAFQDFVLEIDRLHTEIAQIEFNKGRDFLARRLAHDMRSPLSVIKIAVSQLFQSTGESKESLLLLEQAVTRLQGVAADLLQTQQKIENLTFSKWALKESLEEMFEEKKLALGEQKIALELRFPDMELFCSFSKIEFQRHLSNLLNNSIEALASVDAPKILMEVKNLTKGICQLNVWDNGPGVAPHVLSKLGKRLFSTKAISNNSGSGIAIFSCYKFIESLSGQMEIQSVLGEGLKIKLILPVLDSLNSSKDPGQ